MIAYLVDPSLSVLEVVVNPKGLISSARILSDAEKSTGSPKDAIRLFVDRIATNNSGGNELKGSKSSGIGLSEIL